MAKNSFVTFEMRQKYLERRTGELDVSADKLRARDFDYFRNIGHQIKGNAVTFDFPMLTELGVRMENSAVEKNESGVEKVLGELRVAVQELTEQIKTEKPEI